MIFITTRYNDYSIITTRYNDYSIITCIKVPIRRLLSEKTPREIQNRCWDSKDSELQSVSNVKNQTRCIISSGFPMELVTMLKLLHDGMLASVADDALMFSVGQSVALSLLFPLDLFYCLI